MGSKTSGTRRVLTLLAGWTLAGGLLAAQAYVSEAMRGRPVALSRSAAIWLAFAWLWALLTPLVLLVTRRFPFVRGSVLRALLAHAAACAVIVALQLALFAAAAPLVGAESFAGTWLATFRRLLGSAFLLDVPVYAAIVLIAELRARERRTQALEAQLAEARLLALRSQLQPHFLFNALNTVSVLMHEDVEAAERVLVTLGDLLRKALDTSTQNVIPLRDEIAFVRSYLEIEQARFADRLTCAVDVPDSVLDARVPSFILQPLVENAVRHGIARRARPGRIEIAARQSGADLEMTVRDDGPGFPDPARDGIGLSNTRARLAQLYGGAHSFEVTSTPDGTLAALAIPLSTAMETRA